MSRLSIATFPTGIAYADRKRERHGDYLRIAFLPFRALTLKWTRERVPADMRAEIEAHAAKIIARRGESYQVSACGQTVRLG